MAQIIFGLGSSSGPARIPKGRPGAGRFAPDTRTHQEIKDTNAAVAKAFQAQVVDVVRTMPLKRKNVSTGRLEKAMANNKNRHADLFSWGVGDIDYLDQSIAKYWRMIEYGSAGIYGGGRGMTGQKIYGVWGGSIQGYYTNRWGLQPQAGGPWRTAAVNGKLRGMNAKFARKKKIPPMIIQHEIEPHHYFRTAEETYQPGARWSNEIENILSASVSRALTTNTQPVYVRRAMGNRR